MRKHTGAKQNWKEGTVKGEYLKGQLTNLREKWSPKAEAEKQGNTGVWYSKRAGQATQPGLDTAVSVQEGLCIEAFQDSGGLSLGASCRDGLSEPAESTA
eukprot:2716286-Rhodomonas_salina.1